MSNNYLIVPVHNRKTITISFLHKLKRQTIKNYITVVIDDGSKDGTGKEIIKRFPDIRLIKGDGSWWWSKSINKGCEYAIRNGAKNVILLNDDTRFDEDYLEKLLEHGKNNPESVIGSILLTDEQKPKVFFSGSYKSGWVIKTKKRHLKRFQPYNKHLTTGLKPSIEMTGSGLLIPTSVFKIVGFFDDQVFPQYWADLDFVRRANRKGISTYICFDTATYTNIACTGKGASFVKQPFGGFFMAFFNKYSRNNILQTFRFFIRHHPLTFYIRAPLHLVLTIKNHLFLKKQKYE